MINFKEWVKRYKISEMAMVSRQKIPLDQDDIEYLKQFPMEYWASALKQRYNDLIYKAIEMGELRSNWSDIQTVNVNGRAGNYDTLRLTVDTKMRNLINRLKSYGYD